MTESARIACGLWQTAEVGLSQPYGIEAIASFVLRGQLQLHTKSPQLQYNGRDYSIWALGYAGDCRLCHYHTTTKPTRTLQGDMLV
jgi:hypothetical protein